MADLKLDAQPRTVTGRKVGQLRTQGLVPVVVYGNKTAPVNLQVNARALESILHHGGFSQLVQVNVQGGGTHNVLVREIQRHPIKHTFTHVDLYAVNMAEKQHTTVPIVGIGKPEAMVTGLTILQEKDLVAIEALPSDIPASIEVDISALDLDRPITLADLPTVKGVTYLGEDHEHIFTLSQPRVEEIEETPAEEEGEPEIVGHGKQDDDDAAADDE